MVYHCFSDLEKTYYLPKHRHKTDLLFDSKKSDLNSDEDEISNILFNDSMNSIFLLYVFKLFTALNIKYISI